MPDPVRPATTVDPPDIGEETSLASLVDRLTDRGYRCPLIVRDEGVIFCPDHDCTGLASDLTVDAARRFEGESDPSDMSLVAAVRWTAKEQPDCRGVLVLAFGPMALPEHQAALAGLSWDRRRPDQFI